MMWNQRLSDACAAARLRPGDIRTGFTLIEVLMAAFVLALGVLGLAAMFAGAARQQQLASQQTRSVTISQSADAMISENVGKLGTIDCNTALEDVTLYGTIKAYPGQWFVVPIRLEDVTPDMSFVSINPDQDWKTSSSLYFRGKPNQQLPRMLYRAIPDGKNEILIGKTGWDGQSQLDKPPFSEGAPSFDESFGAVRVLSDSVQIRVVTMGYGCAANREDRDLNRPVPSSITLTLDPSFLCDPGDDHVLTGGSGINAMVIDQQREIKDKEFAANPTGESAKITLMNIEDVIGGESDVNCDGIDDYVEVSAGGLPVYTDGNMNGVGPFRFDVYSQGGTSAYRALADGITLQFLAPHDADPDVPANARVLASGRGPYTLISGPGKQPAGFNVRIIDASWRYISEVWLDSFEYRGHRLVSAADRVWFTPDPSRPSGRRADVAYSLLYRDLGPGAGAQYIIFTYALRPSSNNADYVPPEQKEDIRDGDSPVTLVEDVTLDYDADVGKYFIEVQKLGRDEWLAQPGQIVIFAGDGSAGTPLLGADAPVGVQFKREVDGKIRGYLESAPRIGNRSLLEAASPTTKFDVWAVQPTVTSLDESASEWGLRPIEARVFEVFDN